MRRRRLPSLLAVRYFESVGRNLSFTLAAAELNVTQAAVSHQIRLLEEELGVKVFTRLHQRIELTPGGAELLAVATECLDRLADSFDRIGGTERIHLSITPLLSARWLMPQLGDYLAGAARPAEIVLHHSLEPPNEREPRYDLKIFFATRTLPDDTCDFLFADRLVPMCSPALLERLAGRPLAQALARVGIVHEFNYDWWAEWYRLGGLDPALARHGLVVDDPAVLETAALAGHGLILGSTLFLKERLDRGDLALPFGSEPSFPIYYYLLTRPAEARRRGVAALRRWLVQCSASSREAEDARLVVA